jgi:hypothetical protein
MKCRIEIKDANKEALEAALAAVNLRTHAFTTSTYADLVAIVARARRAFDREGVKLGDCGGAVINHCKAGPWAKKYIHGASATLVTIQIGANGRRAFMVGVESDHVYPRTPERFSLALRHSARARWLESKRYVFSEVADAPARRARMPGPPRRDADAIAQAFAAGA